MVRLHLSNSVLFMEHVCLVEFGAVDGILTVYFDSGHYRNYSGDDAAAIVRHLSVR